MSFLYCNPNVMLVKNRYEIVVNTKEEGVCYIKVGKRIFHENASGIMPSVTLVHKFPIPQKVLDEKKEYTVFFKAVYDRKTNFPVVGELKSVTYKFRPIEKHDDINLFYTADIHTMWDEAEKLVQPIKDELDLYIVNGDFGESSSYDNLRDLSKLIGNVTGGCIPCLVGRGNHDTRGKLAEKVTDYMATEQGRSYFEFEAGPIGGIILDCGEDKYDNHPEYESLNFFEQYRKDELKFLKKLKKSEKPFRFGVCHVAWMSGSVMSGQFDIMRDTYAKWNEEVNRLGLEFMVCGHSHRVSYFSDKGHYQDHFAHNYPVVVGSALYERENYMIGTFITLKKSGSVMKYYDNRGNVVYEFTVKDGFEATDVTNEIKNVLQ